MAAKFDKEMLIKHHFWVLFLVLLPVIMIAVVGLMTGVAAASKARRGEIADLDGKLKSAAPKPKSLVEALEVQKGKLNDRRGIMWQAAWDKQKDIYVFPRELSALQNKRAGTEVSESDRSRVSSGEFYFNQFRELPKLVEPTQLNGSWQQVLRYVPQWVKTPSSEEVWLAFEDIWVQRELLNVIREINQSLAGLAPVGPAAESNRFERVFSNRVWELNLKLVDKGTDRILEGTLKNLTDRVQVFGLGNRMNLKVWLNADERQEPFLFRVEGDFVKAGDTVKVGGDARYHKLDADKLSYVDRLIRVEQVFDPRTVPIKRLDKLTLGYGSARTTNVWPLKRTSWSTKVVELKKEAAGAAAPAGGADGGASGAPPGYPGGGMMPTGIGAGGPGGMGGAGGPGGVAPEDMTDNGLVRARYTDVTAQVRRMPLAMMLIVDQMYMQDVMVAFTNSRLRMQNTQCHWNRFRGNLSYVAAQQPGGSPAGGPPAMMPGGRPGPAGGGPSAGGPSGGGPPPGYPGMPGMPGIPGMPGMFGGDAAMSSSEDQLAASLVELSLYGTASLFERFDDSLKDKTLDEISAMPGMIGVKAEPSSEPIAPPAPPVPEPTPPAPAPAPISPAPMPTPMTPPATPMPPPATPMPTPATPPPPAGEPKAATPPAPPGEPKAAPAPPASPAGPKSN